MRKLFFHIFALLALSACTSILEKNPGGMDPSLEGQPVTVTFSLSDVRLKPFTKGVDDASDDGDIDGLPYLDPDKLYLVVCGQNQSIKYIRKAEQVTAESTGDSDIPTLYTFKVKLELSDSYRTVHFLGNINENQLITGSYSYQVLPALLSYSGKQAYWQKVFLKNIHPKTVGGSPVTYTDGSFVPSDDLAQRLSNVPLIRNYAVIQVSDHTEATNPSEKFELYSYAVINYPKRGSVAPYRYKGNEKVRFDFKADYDPDDAEQYILSGYELCSFQDLTDVLEYQGHLPAGIDLEGTIPDSTLFKNPENSGGRVIRYDKSKPDQGFYIYERGLPTTTMDPTFVIIRGRFGEGKYYYYRLDLMETKVVNFESVYQYYPIYRNFRYNIQINRISSQGLTSPEAAANAHVGEDISADISMRHLSDISNGKTRLVVEPFMSQTYTAPCEDDYYYLYARFFNDIGSSVPNTEWGAVTVELEPIGDDVDDILILYDDQGHEVHGGAFYPRAQEMGGEPGFRIIRFNTKPATGESKTQKIKITGRDQYTYEEYPLYREVEITVQKKQKMKLDCNPQELPLQMGAQLKLDITIPADLPSSMFPLDFIIEAEKCTLTPDNTKAGNNLPVQSGISISDHEGYEGKNTFQFLRTLTLDEYELLDKDEGLCTFSSYFKSNRGRSATTIWVDNEYFDKEPVTFKNREELTNHFYVQAEEDGCMVLISSNTLEYKVDDGDWKTNYSTGIRLDRGHKVSFRSTQKTITWSGGNKFYCYQDGSAKEARNGAFSVGGNLASLIVGENYAEQGAGLTDNFLFIDFFKGHTNMVDAYNLELPMLKCNANCYKSMFHDCTSLRRGPKELPATTLAKQCYRNMFYGCSSLVYAPELVAELIDKTECYQRMFYGCSSLKTIRLNCRQYVENCFNSDSGTWWYSGMTEGGTIYLNPDITYYSSYRNVVPKGDGWTWTIKKITDGTDWEEE